MTRFSTLTALAVSLAAAPFGVHAADLPEKPPAPARPPLKAPPPAVYDWTGPYIGINAGGSVGRSRTHTSDPGAVNENETVFLSALGPVGGGQVGYNWQFPGSWGVVVGVEADVQGSGQRGSACISNCLLDGTIALNLQQKLDWFGTVRARAGLASGPVLSYVTGGLAYGRVSTSGSFVGFGPPAIPFAIDSTRIGFAIGSGVEASLGGNWTAKIEYLYVDLGRSSTVVDTTPAAVIFGAPVTVTAQTRDNIFRGGINYRFGGVAAPEVPLAKWAGLYVGGNGGSLYGRNPSSYAIGPGPVPPNRETFDLAPTGYLGGLQVGYNMQASAWVFGVEADLQGALARDRDSCVLACTNLTGTIAFDQKLLWFGTVRGRLGYSVGSTLFYATGGVAYGETKTTIGAAALPPPLLQFPLSHTRVGYVAGGGIESPLEFAGLFGPGWSVKTEYLFLDLGRTSDVLAPFGSVDTFTTRTQAHIFRSGINYNFNSPVAAKF